MPVPMFVFVYCGLLIAFACYPKQLTYLVLSLILIKLLKS